HGAPSRQALTRWDRAAPRAPADGVPAPAAGRSESQEGGGGARNIRDRREAESASRLRGVTGRASRSGGDVVSQELRARVLAAVAAEPSPIRAAIRRRDLLIATVAVASGIGAFVSFAMLLSESHLLRLGGEVMPQQRLERPIALVVATAGGAIAVAATAVWLALGRGRSMLGRSRRWLLNGGVLIPVSLLVWEGSCRLAVGRALGAWPGRPR